MKYYKQFTAAVKAMRKNGVIYYRSKKGYYIRYPKKQDQIDCPTPLNQKKGFSAPTLVVLSIGLSLIIIGHLEGPMWVNTQGIGFVILFYSLLCGFRGG